MKTLYTLILTLLVSASCFADTYYTYTAVKSGSWNDMTVWSIGVRADGVHKTKVVIPNPYIVSVDNAVNSFGLGDVDINLFGSLSLVPATSIGLSAVSTITLYGTGSIIGTNNTQKIIIGSVTKYDGSKDLTKSGASIASAASGISPSGFTPFSVLPVVFTSFTVNIDANDVLLKWSTASEVSNDYYDVQRSYNGSTWTSIATISATGSATSAASYSFTDNNAAGASIYYRLKQVDISGALVYSTIKTIKNGNTPSVKIYGAEKKLNIELNAGIKKAVTVTVMNTSGQVLQKQAFSAGYKITMNLNNPSTGVVIVNVSDNDAVNQTAKLFL